MAKSLAAVLKNVKALSESAEDKNLFAMIYSEFGMGKTTTAMGIAQQLRGDKHILFCDSSDGWTSLEEFPVLMEGADRLQVKDPADLAVIAEGFKKGQLQKTYSVVVIDEASSIFYQIIEDYSRELFGLSEDDMLKPIEGRDYAPPTSAFISILKKIHEADDVHLIITAHSRDVTEDGRKEMRPSFSPTAYREVMRRVQVCAALSVKTKPVPGTKNRVTERTLQLRPTANVAAKTRIPGSPTTVEVGEFLGLVSEWLDSGSFGEEPQDSFEPLIDDELDEALESLAVSEGS